MISLVIHYQQGTRIAELVVEGARTIKRFYRVLVILLIGDSHFLVIHS